MEERNTHIDQWLQQAAARQEQEAASLQEKQAAWAALQGRLSPVPRWRRWRWRFWLGGALLVGAMGYWLFETRPWEEKQGPEAAGMEKVANDGVGERRAVEGVSVEGKDTHSGNVPGANIRRAVDENVPETNNTAEVNENVPGANNGKAAGESLRTEEKDTRSENAPGMNNKKAMHDSTIATGKNAPEAGAVKDKNAGAKKESGDIPNKIPPNNTDLSRAQHRMHTAVHTPGADGYAGTKNTHPIPDAALSPAATIHRSASNPSTSLTRSLPPAMRLRHVQETNKRFNAPGTGFSMKWAGTVPQNGIHAFNLSAAYTFPLSKRLSLHPYIGGGYTGGFNVAYRHQAFYERPNGTGNRIWIDSIVTNFNATSAWLGEGGLQVAYGYRKWELFAGIAYQRMFRVNGREDSAFTTRTDSVHLPAYQPQLFSPGRLPGIGRFILQTGINYRLAPQWQAGLRYNVRLQAQPAGKGFMGNTPVLPFSSSLVVQVRWYFPKKNFQGTQPLP